MTDCAFGIAGKDWVIIAADSHVEQSIVKFKTTEDKIYEMDNNKLVAGSNNKTNNNNNNRYHHHHHDLLLLAAGPQADSNQFLEFISRNVELYALVNGVQLTTHALASFTRNELADALRKGPYQVNMLIGGYDDKDGSASLYYMDYLASCQKITRGAHGYAAYFVLGLLDKLYKKDMTQEDGLDAIKQCIKVIVVLVDILITSSSSSSYSFRSVRKGLSLTKVISSSKL
ncbi:proteasome subunit beta type 2, putative [Perkinsus marinus ATCC 50983]|uniref:Proteasome subunit beta type 2, putative n=1 Tax=Perkinsus marinus (strain ATCC 50983 / TXsc) TaxID=423536 RepID=C5L243_PERM5|nr:proteasome subunit beta type 2, putative [Perkinsus marinus ATCC 50983]EER09201.1 proteasome subunit beta type 2, putative [Perkinsus marinus ATCC 50983]|eukprot:XP_002777385.1 proteasome subunit beta type 2, putative [Perkinsus marinus ATCC 50983]